MSDVLVEELKTLLSDDYYELTRKGDKIASETSDGEFLTVADEELDFSRWTKYMRSITRLPDGRHFAWEWESGLTENQDDIGPAEYGEPKLTEVTSRIVIVEKTVWEAI